MQFVNLKIFVIINTPHFHTQVIAACYATALKVAPLLVLGAPDEHATEPAVSAALYAIEPAVSTAAGGAGGNNFDCETGLTSKLIEILLIILTHHFLLFRKTDYTFLLYINKNISNYRISVLKKNVTCLYIYIKKILNVY